MATYTAADELDLASIAKRYGLDDISLEPLNGGAANSSFKASCEQGEFVLTVLDNHDPRSAEILAAHTRALFERGMPTVRTSRWSTAGACSSSDGFPGRSSNRFRTIFWRRPAGSSRSCTD